MPSLDLVPTSFRLFVEARENVLLGEIQLKRRQSVKLTTDEDFNKLDGILRLVEETNEGSHDSKPIGWITYCEEFNMIDSYSKASYTVEVCIPRTRFELLLAAVNRGKMPSQITVDVEGMTFDWQPNGSGKVWDNKSSKQLPIKSVFFITPLVGGDPHDFLDDRSPEDGIPPNRAQLNQI